MIIIFINQPHISQPDIILRTKKREQHGEFILPDLLSILGHLTTPLFSHPQFEIKTASISWKFFSVYKRHIPKSYYKYNYKWHNDNSRKKTNQEHSHAVIKVLAQQGDK